MLKNPLIPDILKLLQQHPEGISEYLIIKSLDEHIAFNDIDADYQLAIFQKHFMVMNALHQLQQQLLIDENLYLDISALKIQLLAGEKQSSETQLSDDTNAKLGEYYLDWSNFENTDKAGVEKLLDYFWELYARHDSRSESLRILELEESANADAITQRYRELAARHHPDKGGDPATFIQIRQAYETLKPFK